MSECAEDREMVSMASQDLGDASESVKRLHNLLLKLLLPKDDADERDCILEVRAGAGGDEASLFAFDIFKMYVFISVKSPFPLILISYLLLTGMRSTPSTRAGTSKSLM